MSSAALHDNTLSPHNETLDIRDEHRLLLLCARTRVKPEQSEQIQALVLKHLDWVFVLDKAQPRALIPLLYRNLSTHCADLVPSQVLQQLESDNKIDAERNRKNTAEMVKMLRDCKVVNISAVPLKGPALAVQAHGDIEFRKFWDQDIVILPRDIPAAKSLLLSLGYEWHPMQGQVTGRNEACNSAVQALIEHVRRRLFDKQAVIDYFVERERFHSKVRERFRDRILAYWHMIKAEYVKIFVPDSKTQELAKPPAALSALYYLLYTDGLACKVLTHNIRRGESTP